MRGKVLCFLHIAQHKNGTQSVPGCIPTRSVGNDHGAAGRDWSADRPPSSERRPEQARSHRVRCVPARDWSADRPPSRASSLPQGSMCACKRLVGCQAAIAGRPAPTVKWGASARDWLADRPPLLAGQLPQGNGVHLRETGRLSGRHRCDAASRQASSHNGPVSTTRPSPLNRPSGSSPAFDFDPPAPSAG